MTTLVERDALLDMLREGVAEVTFNKLNGDRRVMTCTLMPKMLPTQVKESLEPTKMREPNLAVVSVWDLNANGWRSFRLDRVEKVVLQGSDQ